MAVYNDDEARMAVEPEEIEWKRKVLKLLAVRKLIESNPNTDYERNTTTVLPPVDYTDRRSSQPPRHDAPDVGFCDCPYWQHEGLEF